MLQSTQFRVSSIQCSSGTVRSLRTFLNTILLTSRPAQPSVWQEQSESINRTIINVDGASARWYPGSLSLSLKASTIFFFSRVFAIFFRLSRRVESSDGTNRALLREPEDFVAVRIFFGSIRSIIPAIYYSRIYPESRKMPLDCRKCHRIHT